MTDEQFNHVIQQLNKQDESINALMDMQKRLAERMLYVQKEVIKVDNKVDDAYTKTEEALVQVNNSATAAAAAAASAEAAVSKADEAAHYTIDMVNKTEARFIELTTDIHAYEASLNEQVAAFERNVCVTLDKLYALIQQQQDENVAYREKVIVTVLNAFMQETNNCMKSIAQGNVDILKQLMSH